MHNTLLLDAQQITKVYQRAAVGVTALADVSLTIQPGELVVVTGTSGSGKTTLLNLLGGLDTPSAGRIFIQGRDLQALGRNQIAHLRGETIGFVFQQSHLIRHLTALQNVLLPFELAGLAPDRTRALTLLKLVGLGQRAHHRPAELSGGEQQRVAIARALVRGPQLILADEPTGSLDHATGLAIVDILAGLVDPTRTRSVVIVTHQPELVRRPHRRLHLHDGKLVQERGPKTLRR